MTKPEFEWIPFDGGEIYVPKGGGPADRLARIVPGGQAFLLDCPVDLSRGQIEFFYWYVASALATPASDGLPEGWKGYSALRNDGLEVRLFADNYVTTWSSEPRPATMSLSEACLAANERFPVAKPEAPGRPWWIAPAPEGFHAVFFRDGTRSAENFSTTADALAWADARADRERPAA